MQRFFLLLLAGSTFLACNTGTKTAENQATTETTAQADGRATTKATPLTDRLTGLGLTADSHWRGINLGMPLATVRATESQTRPEGDLFEDQADHLGYAVDFPNLESMDALYYQTGGKVSAIEVDLYLNSKAAIAAYLTDLAAYFTSRYGTGQAKDGTTNWTGPQGEPIQLNDVSKGKDFGVKIRIGTRPAKLS